MVDIEDAHIGAAAGAALFDHIGGGVKGVDKADRAGGHAAGSADHIPLGAQAGKGKAGAAAAFMNQGGLPYPVKDGFQGIVHRQHKAGGKLLQLPAGVHQGGGVGHKLQTPHHIIELLLGGLPFPLRAVVVQVGLGQVAGDPAKHPVRVFEDIALPVFGQVAAMQHHPGVFGQGGGAIVDLAADAGGGQGVPEPAARLYGGLARTFFNGKGCHFLTLAALKNKNEFGLDSRVSGNDGRGRPGTPCPISGKTFDAIPLTPLPSFPRKRESKTSTRKLRRLFAACRIPA